MRYGRYNGPHVYALQSDFVFGKVVWQPMGSNVVARHPCSSALASRFVPTLRPGLDAFLLPLYLVPAWSALVWVPW